MKLFLTEQSLLCANTNPKLQLDTISHIIPTKTYFIGYSLEVFIMNDKLPGMSIKTSVFVKK